MLCSQVTCYGVRDCLPSSKAPKRTAHCGRTSVVVLAATTKVANRSEENIDPRRDTILVRVVEGWYDVDNVMLHC